jgi:hypothetical protein
MLLTLYQKILIRLVDCVKSYELREGRTVIEVEVAKSVILGNSDFAVICPRL